MAKSKTYMKRVFAGKEVPVIGMDQGKGKHYGGNGTSNVFNLLYDGAMEVRDGQNIDGQYDDGIMFGGILATIGTIISGSNVYSERYGAPEASPVDPVAAFDWESLWTALSERAYSVNATQPSAYITYDTTTYAGRRQLLEDCQTFFTVMVAGGPEDIVGFFLKANDKTTIEATLFDRADAATSIGHTFGSLKTASTWTSGFPRFISGGSAGFGTIVDGDDISVDTINTVIDFFNECTYPFVVIDTSANPDYVDYISYKGNRFSTSEWSFYDSAVSYQDAIDNLAFDGDSVRQYIRGGFEQYDSGGGTPFSVDGYNTKSTSDTLYTEATPPIVVNSLDILLFNDNSDWDEFNNAPKTGFGTVVAPVIGGLSDYYAKFLVEAHTAGANYGPLTFDLVTTAEVGEVFYFTRLFVGAKLNVTFSPLVEA